MNVALIVQRFPHGGAESYVEEIAQRLHAKGNDVTVISSQNKDCDDTSYPFSIIRLSKSFSIGEYSIWKGLDKVLENGKFDLVHVNTYGYYHSDKSARLKNKLGYKLVMTSHGFTGMDIHKMKKKKIISKTSKFDFLREFYDNNIGIKTLKRCDHLIALSEYDQKVYKIIGISENKISNIPPGISSEFFIPKGEKVISLKQSFNADNVLLSVGEINWIKNHAMVIRILPKIIQKFPRTKYLIIGNDGGELGNLQKLVNELHVDENVVFLGHKKKEDVSQYMQSSHLLIHTSYAEGLSTVLLESMASGLPFITTPSGGNEYLATESQAGVTITFDEVSLFDALSKLLSDKEMIQTMANNGRLYAKDLSWDKIYEKITKVYRDLLNHYRN